METKGQITIELTLKEALLIIIREAELRRQLADLQAKLDAMARPLDVYC